MIPQDLFQKEKQEPVRAQLATVTQVTEDGVMLLVDGENDAGQTACRYLSSYSPKPGDRVYFQRVGGAMLVMGSVI